MEADIEWVGDGQRSFRAYNLLQLNFQWQNKMFAFIIFSWRFFFLCLHLFWFVLHSGMHMYLYVYRAENAVLCERCERERRWVADGFRLHIVLYRVWQWIKLDLECINNYDFNIFFERNHMMQCHILAWQARKQANEEMMMNKTGHARLKKRARRKTKRNSGYTEWHNGEMLIMLYLNVCNIYKTTTRNYHQFTFIYAQQCWCWICTSTRWAKQRLSGWRMVLIVILMVVCWCHIIIP